MKNPLPQTHLVDLPWRFPLFLKFGFWACISIAVAAVMRRAFALLAPANPEAPPQLANLDAFFRAHALLTWVHILCAVVLVVWLPLLFWQRTRTLPWVERSFFVLGLVVAITAYAMTHYSVGGWLERSAVLVFDTLYAFSLVRAWLFARRGDDMQKRIWMLRAIAVLLGIATTRPVMGVFFATAPATHLTPREFFGIAFWIGFSINTIVFELWLRLRRSHAEKIYS